MTTLSSSDAASTALTSGARRGARGGPNRHGRFGWLFHPVMILVSLVWLVPMVFVVVTAFRTFDDIAARGLGALPGGLSLEGFRIALGPQAAIGKGLVNGAIITVPAVIFSLLFGSMAAYALSRYAVPFRRTFLLVMLAGNLLPPQILLIPVAKIMEGVGLYDNLLGLIVIHVGFGLGFYTFVLHGFMRGLPSELTEAATIDGAGPFAIYWRIILPLCRPALAALGALATTWVFNDLIWAISVLRSDTKFPITAALSNLQGAYVSEWNVIAAAATIAAVPTAIVFFAFQKHFVSGLLVGTTK